MQKLLYLMKRFFFIQTDMRLREKNYDKKYDWLWPRRSDHQGT